MAIEWEVLGRPGADNALHLTVDTGQSRESVLFDCGEAVLDSLRQAEIQSVSHLCFSHFHMDHIAGFDGFFRRNYNRPDGPVCVWGPAGTIALMEHRFHGFTWNLHEGQPGEWIVREIDGDLVRTARFLTREAFSPAHHQPDNPCDERIVLRTPSWQLETFPLPHGGITSLGYRLVETDKQNIDPVAMHRGNYLPGPWLREVIESDGAEESLVEVGGRPVRVAELRKELLMTSPGDSLAYLTDFRVEPGSEIWTCLVDWLRGTGTLVCECQYLSADKALAEKNAHLTASLAGRLAADAGVGRLVLHHLSRRYAAVDWPKLRAEAREFYPRAEFPENWGMSG